MFTSIFGKRRSSPVQDETPPIPGPKPDDSFVMVDPSSPRTGIYPSVSGGPNPVAPYVRQAPAPPLPKVNTTDTTFHYLQGVPFSLSTDLKLASNKNSLSTEIGDLLAFLTNKVNISNYEYDFVVEKSVLKEC